MWKSMKWLIMCIIIGSLCVGCGSKPKPDSVDSLITIGFSQVGAESDWRTANSISMKTTFTTTKGYDLIFKDARQKQENQIMAIRGFIQQEVDYIVFSPVVESGWDTVLEEAKRAGIPVIVIDRMVDVEDDGLFTAWIGSDFYQQGKLACLALKEYIDSKGMTEVNIVNIQGTLGATAQIGRTKALEEAAKEYGWNLLVQTPADYTSAKAQEVMTDILTQYKDIDFVFCENDNEATGAMEAMRLAGRSFGKDGEIKVISYDATKEGLLNTFVENILLDVECNPNQGPEIERIICQLEQGEVPEKYTYMPEKIFSNAIGIEKLLVNGDEVPVITLTEAFIRGRDY